MPKLIPVAGAPFSYAILTLADLTEPIEARLPAFVTEADVLLREVIAAGGDDLVTVANPADQGTWLRVYSRPLTNVGTDD